MVLGSFETMIKVRGSGLLKLHVYTTDSLRNLASEFWVVKGNYPHGRMFSVNTKASPVFSRMSTSVPAILSSTGVLTTSVTLPDDTGFSPVDSIFIRPPYLEGSSKKRGE